MASMRYIEYGVIEQNGQAEFGSCNVRSLLWHWLTGNYHEPAAAMFVFDSNGTKYRARYDGLASSGANREIEVWTLTAGSETLCGYVDATGWFLPLGQPQTLDARES